MTYRRISKQAKTCFACEARKYSWGWGHNLQILVHLDRDKNCSVGIAGALVASEKRLMVGLCFVKKTTNRACEWGETYGRTLFFLFVTKVTNRACEWEEKYSWTCFYFLFIILMTNWTYQWKRPTDSTVASESLLVARREWALKKKKFLFHPVLEIWRMRSTPSLPWLSGPLWPSVAAPDRVLSMGQTVHEQTVH